MPDSSNGTPLPDENKEPNPSPEAPRLPRIAPPEGLRAARGQKFDDDDDAGPLEADGEEPFTTDASIDPDALFPEDELDLEPPLGINAVDYSAGAVERDNDGIDKADTFGNPYSRESEEEAAAAERYRVSSLREDTPRDKEAGLMEHLNELRVRLLWSFLSVGLAMCITWNYREYLQGWFSAPIFKVLRESQPSTGAPVTNMPISVEPTGFFSIAFQFSLISALILVMPFIFFQAWRFIEPALTNNERKYTLVLVPFSSILFFLGAGLGFYVSPLFFKFFLQFQPAGVAAMWDYYQCLLIMAKMLLVFGVAFQVPIIVIFGVKIGLLTREILIQYWRHAVVVIFVVCAVLTPTWDPVTLGVCATPPCLLYALSIWIVKWI